MTLRAEPNTALYQIRAACSCSRVDQLLPELNPEQCWLCSRGADLGKTERIKEKQFFRHKDQCRKSSKHTAAAPCWSRKAHGGAGHPLAAHGHPTKQISLRSHGGAVVWLWMRLVGGIAHRYRCRSSPGRSCSSLGAM